MCFHAPLGTSSNSGEACPPLDTRDLANWQTGVLVYWARIVNGLEVDEDSFRTTLFHLLFRQELM